MTILNVKKLKTVISYNYCYQYTSGWKTEIN